MGVAFGILNFASDLVWRQHGDFRGVRECGYSDGCGYGRAGVR